MIFDLVYIVHVLHNPEFWVAVASICFFIPVIGYCINFLNHKAVEYVQAVKNNYQRSDILIIETENELLLARNKLDNFHFTKYTKIFDQANLNIKQVIEDYSYDLNCKFEKYCTEQNVLFNFLSKQQFIDVRRSFIKESMAVSIFIMKNKVNEDYHNVFFDDNCINILSFFNQV